MIEGERRIYFLVRLARFATDTTPPVTRLSFFLRSSYPALPLHLKFCSRSLPFLMMQESRPFTPRGPIAGLFFNVSFPSYWRVGAVLESTYPSSFWHIITVQYTIRRAPFAPSPMQSGSKIHSWKGGKIA